MLASIMDLSVAPSADRPLEDEMREAEAGFLRLLGSTGTLSALQQSLTMSELCVLLEGALNRIFVDETGATALYRITVQADVPDSEAFLDVLCTELGLIVTPGRREIDVLVVD